MVAQGHTLLEHVQGADPAALRKAVETHVDAPPPIVALSHTDQAPAPPPTTVGTLESQGQLEKRLRGLMTQSKIVLFMKGDPDQPRCGFSRKAVALLRDQGTEFTHFDILTDEAVRAGEPSFFSPSRHVLLAAFPGLKKLNDWPTYPQFIVSGEFIGGLDVVTEMVANGEFSQIAA
jgi:glutaredoxin-related protein